MTYEHGVAVSCSAEVVTTFAGQYVSQPQCMKVSALDSDGWQLGCPQHKF